MRGRSASSVSLRRRPSQQTQDLWRGFSSAPRNPVGPGVLPARGLSCTPLKRAIFLDCPVPPDGWRVAVNLCFH